MIPRLAGLVLIGVGLAVLILGGLLFWNSLQTRMALEQASADARSQAQNLERQLQAIDRALTSDAFAAVVFDEDAGRNDSIRVLREQEVRNVLNIVVAREAVESVDLTAFPGSGFAALQMLLQARTEGSVPAQVHFAGTPDEYLAVAARLDPDDPASPVALATFPVSVLANQVALPETLDAMRLVQVIDGAETPLEEFGGGFANPDSVLPIDGSLFRLAWYRSKALNPLSTGQLAGVLGIGLLTALLGFLIVQRTSKPEPVDEEREEPVETIPEEADAASRAGRTEMLDPDSLEPAEADTRESGTAVSDWPESPETEEAHETTVDGEPRRERPEARDLDFDDGAGEGTSAKGEQAGESEAVTEGDLEFDPDAPEDDSTEISEMLRSLVDDDTKPEQADPAEQVDATDDAPVAGETGAEEPERDQDADVVVPPESIFRAYDIRGIVGDTLSPEIAEAIGRAIGSEARHKGLNRIAVARDGRLSGAELLAALGGGLQATGLDVIDVGAVPTPVLYYAAQEIAGGSGVMVTGSHNPPDYNGFKIVLGGETLSGDRISALHKRLADGDLVSGSGQVTEHRITVQYIERIGTDIQLEKPLKVVADCGNGIAGAVAPKLLEAIGAEVIPLYAEVDGTFPNHHPDPGDPDTLEDLKLCVRNFNADVGVAFDGDGDRLGVVAPDGEIIYPDRLMMLFARDVLSRNPGQPVIFDVKCSGLLAGEIEDAGGKPVMARTGHSFIKAQLKREQAPLAGEMSGHFFFAERWYGFDDGMYAAARLLEILAADTRAPGQILGTLPKAVSTPELKVEMKEGEPHPFVEEFKKRAKFEGAEINDIDGVRADFEDGFGLVRASNTTPVLVVRFEGTDKKALSRIQQLFRDAMLDVNPALKLPF
ncbi:MAG: hypothetical protein ACNS61_10460 [Candidatus Wenzhouxiangella sp. M2_3B_020]